MLTPSSVWWRAWVPGEPVHISSGSKAPHMLYLQQPAAPRRLCRARTFLCRNPCGHHAAARPAATRALCITHTCAHVSVHPHAWWVVTVAIHVPVTRDSLATCPSIGGFWGLAVAGDMGHHPLAAEAAGNKLASPARTGSGFVTKWLELDPGTKTKSCASRKPGTNFGSHEELRELFVFS